jgi:hypothetical protein
VVSAGGWREPHPYLQKNKKATSFQKQNIDFAFVLGGGLCRFRGS